MPSSSSTLSNLGKFVFPVHLEPVKTATNE